MTQQELALLNLLAAMFEHLAQSELGIVTLATMW
jgi:hypothetical protein